MPLRDHFRPPLSVTHPWKGFHSAWANAITNQLNEVLPEGYYAIPEVPLGDQVEIDVATLEEERNSAQTGVGVATAVWAPPRPLLAAVVDFPRVHGVAVHIFQDVGGPQLRAAIELVSPANKDRPRSRLTFAAKCVGYLERGAGGSVRVGLGGAVASLCRRLSDGRGGRPNSRRDLARSARGRRGPADAAAVAECSAVPATPAGNELHHRLPLAANRSLTGEW